MKGSALQLSYWLPLSNFTVEATTRSDVNKDKDTGKWAVKKVVDVVIRPGVTADPNGPLTLSVDVGLLEKIALSISLDDQGLIESINGETGRDIASVISVAGKFVSLAALVATAMTPFKKDDTDLEEKWKASHENLYRQAAALTTRIGELLDKLVAEHTSPDDIDHLGDALEVLQSQLGLISEAKRSWIADHAKVLDSATYDLTVDRLVRLQGNQFPDLIASADLPPHSQETLTSRFDVLIAILDPDRGGPADRVGPGLVDEVALRRCRPATVAAYVRNGEQWKLAADSIHKLDVVDGHSGIDRVSLDGSWLRTRKFELSYHPDKSVKSFGVTTMSAASTVGASLGDVIDAADAARKEIQARPSAEAARLSRVKTQLELLETATEYERVSATRNLPAELAGLEQRTKLQVASK